MLECLVSLGGGRRGVGGAEPPRSSPSRASHEGTGRRSDFAKTAKRWSDPRSGERKCVAVFAKIAETLRCRSDCERRRPLKTNYFKKQNFFKNTNSKKSFFNFAAFIIRDFYNYSTY